MSDEWWAYTKLDKDYKHSVVKHKRKEYVRGDVYTNTIEGAWSHLKRSMMGTYHRPSKEHLSKYCAEFEFTYNTRKKTPQAKFNQIIDKNLICVGIRMVDKFKSMLIRDLQNRLAYVNMKNYGWEVSANSAKPPIFADEYLVSETERIFEVTIKEPIIITVDVELPRAEKTI